VVTCGVRLDDKLGRNLGGKIGAYKLVSTQRGVEIGVNFSGKIVEENWGI